MNRVMVEVDATPEVMRQELVAWSERNAERLQEEQFSWAPGDFVRFVPALAAGLQIETDAPVLVLATGDGAPAGHVAYFGPDGAIKTMTVPANQVRNAADATG